MKIDGHVHTPFCPHGTTDSFEDYIHKAIQKGFTSISFTEHAPLPNSFIDPTPDQDSGMKREYIEEYFSTLSSLKKQYLGKITIHIGLEVDYILGYENETRTLLNEYGPFMDDSILSVHFLKKDEDFYCLDFSQEMFQKMVGIFGSVSAIYKSYYETVLESIKADLGDHKPKRMGHITLAHKFQHAFPTDFEETEIIESILNEITKRGYALDYNSAGLRKPLCKETYPPQWVVKMAKQKKIPLVYGSDAHLAEDLGQSYHIVQEGLKNQTDNR